MKQSRFKRSILFCLAFFLLFWIPLQAQAGGGNDDSSLPPIPESIQIALKNYPGEVSSEISYKVHKNILLWLAKKEQLAISDEVKGHFETAVSKAEEKMETGEGEVTQSAITKLKLGLAGTENDIAKFNAEIQLARLRLAWLLKREFPDTTEPAEDGLPIQEFAATNLEEFLGDGRKRKKLSALQTLELKEQLVEVNKSRTQMQMAKKNRKITRALLVTEVANYDFGIGNEGDLFEALIIYTRVLVGYYDSIYSFNISVLEMEKLYAGIAS